MPLQFLCRYSTAKLIMNNYEFVFAPLAISSRSFTFWSVRDAFSWIMARSWPPPHRRTSADCGGYRRPDTKPACRIDGVHALPSPSVVVWRARTIWLCSTPSYYRPSSSDSTPSRWSEATAAAVALQCNCDASRADIRRNMVRTKRSQARI